MNEEFNPMSGRTGRMGSSSRTRVGLLAWGAIFGGACDTLATSAGNGGQVGSMGTAPDSTNEANNKPPTELGSTPLSVCTAESNFEQGQCDGFEYTTYRFGTDSNEYVYAAVASAQGDVWLGGTTRGDFQGSGPPDGRAFVRGYAADGSLINTIQFGPGTEHRVNDLALDSQGTIWVTGYTSGDLDARNLGGYDGFVRGFAPTGELVDAVQFGTEGYEQVEAIALDAEGNRWIAGNTTGDLGAPNEGGGDIFLRRHGAVASDPFTLQFGTSDADYAHGLAIDSSNNVWVAGNTRGDLATGLSAGQWDAYLRAYTSDGTLLRSIQFGTSEEDTIHAIAIDAQDRIWVVGSSGGDLDALNLGGIDAFVRSYTLDSDEPLTRWQYGSPNSEYPQGLAIDARGGVWVVGITQGSIGMSTGSDDVFVSTLNADGTPKATLQFGTITGDGGRAVATDALGHVFVAGDTFGTPSSINDVHNDGFVRRFTLP